MKEVGRTGKYVQHWASDRQHLFSLLCATEQEED